MLPSFSAIIQRDIRRTDVKKIKNKKKRFSQGGRGFQSTCGGTGAVSHRPPCSRRTQTCRPCHRRSAGVTAERCLFLFFRSGCPACVCAHQTWNAGAGQGRLRKASQQSADGARRPPPHRSAPQRTAPHRTAAHRSAARSFSNSKNIPRQPKTPLSSAQR